FVTNLSLRLEVLSPAWGHLATAEQVTFANCDRIEPHSLGTSFALVYCRRSEHDLFGISVPKTPAASPRLRDGIRGGGTSRPQRTVPRKPLLVLSWGKRFAAPAASRPLHCPGSDRHGCPR